MVAARIVRLELFFEPKYTLAPRVSLLHGYRGRYQLGLTPSQVKNVYGTSVGKVVDDWRERVEDSSTPAIPLSVQDASRQSSS